MKPPPKPTRNPAPKSMVLDPQGGLELHLHLGPENPHQQFSPAADGVSTVASAIERSGKTPFPRRGNGSVFHSASVAITGSEEP